MKPEKRLHPLLLATVFLLTIALLSGCGSKNPALTSAKIYLDLTPPDYDRATEQLLLAVAKDSLSGEAHLLLGKIYGEKNMYQEMLEELRKAESCKLKPEQLESLALMKSGKWTELFNSGVELGKRRRRVAEVRLELLADFSRYREFKDSLRSISSHLEDAGRFKWDNYDKYVQVKPALEDLERMLDEKGFQHYQLAIQLDSTRYEPFFNLAGEFVDKDELNKALDYYQKAHQLKPDDSNVMNNYALVLLNSQRFDQALGLYQRILEKDPTNVNALVNVAMIYARQGETERSLDTYSRIVSVDPEYMDAYFNRGLLYLSQAQGMMPVLKTYKDSVGKHNRDKELASRYQSAWAKYEQLFLKAESDFNKGIEIDPKDKDAHFHLGLLYVGRAQLQTEKDKQAQDFTQAEESFKRSLELDTEDIESMRYLGFTLLSLKKWQAASLPLEKLIRLDPTDREAWGYLAIAYANLGKKDEAEQALKKSAR